LLLMEHVLAQEAQHVIRALRLRYELVASRTCAVGVKIGASCALKEVNRSVVRFRPARRSAHPRSLGLAASPRCVLFLLATNSNPDSGSQAASDKSDDFFKHFYRITYSIIVLKPKTVTFVTRLGTERPRWGCLAGFPGGEEETPLWLGPPALPASCLSEFGFTGTRTDRGDDDGRRRQGPFKWDDPELSGVLD
jgi:hypothetical protein